MKKNLSLPILVYEMLVEVSRKSRKKPDQWLEEIVKEHFKKV
tara:strand:- start:261 stop:386 length:126 start_codon:yes stop_codon:yes gene_type:complete